MITRKELLQSKEYWLARLQANLYSLLENYMEENGLNRTKLAEELGVSKGYVSQILNGDYDHRLSKLIELSLAIKKVPQIHFQDIDQIFEDDDMGLLYENEIMKRPIIKLELNFGPYEENINYDWNKKYNTEDEQILTTSYYDTLKGAQLSNSNEILS